MINIIPVFVYYPICSNFRSPDQGWFVIGFILLEFVGRDGIIMTSFRSVCLAEVKTWRCRTRRRERQLTQPRNFGSGKASDEVWKNQGQDIYLSSTCGNAQWTSMNWFFLWQIQDNYTGHSLLDFFLKETASRSWWIHLSCRCFTVPNDLGTGHLRHRVQTPQAWDWADPWARSQMIDL